jgi:hypothetical protein
MNLLPLAIQACQDRTAQAVLGDAVLESGWADERVTALLLMPRWWVRGWWWADWADWLAWTHTRSEERARNLSRKRARRPTRRWCRAVLAVLLFGEWTETRWPLIEAVWVAPILRADWGRALQDIERTDRGEYTVTLGQRYEQIRDLVDYGVVDGKQARRLLDDVVGPEATPPRPRQIQGFPAPSSLRVTRRR